MAIKIASCEDNPAIRDSLALFFEQIRKEDPNLSVTVDFFVNGEQLLGKRKTDYDIYILDIHMGDENINGMTLAQSIRKYDDHALIIFLTSLTRYLKEGYKVKAYRYLTKPVSYEEFKHEILSAIRDIRKNSDNYLNLVGHSKFNRICLEDIYYIETDGRKSLIHAKSGEIPCTYSLSTLTEMLREKNFYRCHTSYLVNIQYVESFDTKVAVVHGTEILVSRNKLRGLKELVAASVGNFF